MVISRSSTLTWPASTNRKASRNSAPCKRFRIKPCGSPCTITGFCWTSNMIWRVASTTSALVHGEAQISTRGIRYGGVTGRDNMQSVQPAKESAECETRDVEGANDTYQL